MTYYLLGIATGVVITLAASHMDKVKLLFGKIKDAVASLRAEKK